MAVPTKTEDSEARQALGLAHVLFIDPVGYSLLATDAEQRNLLQLQKEIGARSDQVADAGS